MFLCCDLFIYICKEQNLLIFQSALLLCQMFKNYQIRTQSVWWVVFPLRQLLIRNTCLLCITTSILVAQLSHNPEELKLNLHVLLEFLSSELICTKIKSWKNVPFIIHFTSSSKHRHQSSKVSNVTWSHTLITTLW